MRNRALTEKSRTIFTDVAQRVTAIPTSANVVLWINRLGVFNVH